MLTAASAKTVNIVGHAKDENNKPAAGAVAQLVRTTVTGNNKLTRQVVATTRTDANGRFAFAQPVQAVDFFMASVHWQGYDYQDIAYVGLGANQGHAKEMGLQQVNPGNIQVQVYSSTRNPVPITAMVHHLAIKSDGSNLKCVERFVWSNTSHQRYLGSGPQNVTIKLNLPPSAQNVKIDPKIRDAKLVKMADGWGVAQPILPSIVDTPALIVNYTVPWPPTMPWSSGLDLSKTIDYPTNFFFVARETDDKKIQVTAPQLGPDEEQPLPIGDKQEVRIVNSIGAPTIDSPALKAGQRVEIHVGRPVSPLFYAFCLFVGALFIMVPATLVGGRRAKQGMLNGSSKTLEPSGTGGVYAASLTPSGGGERFAISTDSRARHLVQEIARLDDAWEAGTLDADAYQTQRAAWKAELVKQMERDG